jgi:histidine phosphotransferase ChpT
MSDTELELAQLLCTRLCHDLAGPVGAVAAGVELIGGDPSQADPETLGLIGNSSAAAALKLKFMRTALGAAGGASSDPKTLLEGYLETVAGPAGKPVLTWPSAENMVAGAAALGAGWIQTVLNLCLLGLEAQPGCRTLSLQITQGANFTAVVDVRGAEGRATTVREELIAAVEGRESPALNAKTVHGNIVGRIVRAAGGKIDLAAAGNGVTVTAVFPKAGAALS